jgi:two-component system, NtrC family, sensor histidine kinase HydH
MSETLLDELKRYVGWSTEDERALRTLHGPASHRFGAVAEVFYEVILMHEGARRSLVGGESMVGNLKPTLRRWLDTLLSGPWDEAYYQARCRIGRVHVRIGLPQHYMFGAMNVLRRELNQIVDDTYLTRAAELRAARMALGRALDLELAIMLHTFREDLLAAQARQERLATFGQLMASIGHDLRNPLGVIETSLYIVKGRPGLDERARKHLERIGEQVAVANGIIANLLDIIRNRPLVREPVRLADLVGSAAGSVARPEDVHYEQHGLSELPPVSGDPGQLRQVFVNLIENAVQAASPRGRVRVRGGLAGGLVEVAIEDTGPGVDDSTRPRLFEPLITTKPRGTGLGLALVKRIVERHGGTVAYTYREGACFTVSLPT